MAGYSALAYAWIASRTASVDSGLRPLLTMSPATGDINVMIVVAVILIALFLLLGTVVKLIKKNKDGIQPDALK